MSSDYENLEKQSLKAGWGDILPPEERSLLIKEVERWLLYRGTDKYWFEKAFKALLQEIYSLEDKKGESQ